MTDPAHSDRRRENLIRAHQTGANAAEKRPGPQVAKSVTGPPSVPPDPHRETLIRTDIANAARRLTDRCQTELESLTDAQPPPGKPPGPSRNLAAMETLLLARPSPPPPGNRPVLPAAVPLWKPRSRRNCSRPPRPGPDRPQRQIRPPALRRPQRRPDG